MKRFLFAVAMAAPIVGHATSEEGIFIDGAAGRASITSFWPTSTVLAGDVGYRWDWFDVSLGYVDFSRESQSAYGTIGDVHGLLTKYTNAEHGVTADVGGRWNLDPNWYIGAKAGLYFWNNGVDSYVAEKPSDSARMHYSGTAWNAGVDFGYHFSPHWSVALDYTLYRDDGHTADPISIKAEFQF